MTDAPSWMGHLGITIIIAALPFIIIVGTSFAKISVVLHIVRSALGAPAIPPTAVITGLAAVMSFFIMAPVAEEMATSLIETANTTPVNPAHSDPLGIRQAQNFYDAATPPLVAFLKLNTPAGEIDFFKSLAGQSANQTPGLRLLLPAFAIAELVEAFLIGFLIFVPFFVVDLIVANTLLALGMQTMSPQAVALPLKLLLFIIADGWHVIVNGLVVSYGM